MSTSKYNLRHRESTPKSSPPQYRRYSNSDSDEDVPDSPVSLRWTESPGGLHQSHLSSSHESLSKSGLYPDLEDDSILNSPSVANRSAQPRRGSFGSARKNNTPRSPRDSSVCDHSISQRDSDNERITDNQKFRSPKENLYPRVSPRAPVRKRQNVVEPVSPHNTHKVSKNYKGSEGKPAPVMMINTCIHYIYVRRESRFLWAVIILLAITLLFLAYIMCFQSEQKEIHSVRLSAREQEFEKFKNHLKQLQKSFPSQTSKFWRTIRGALKHIIVDEEPEYPSTLLFAVPSSASNVASCISTKVTRALNKIFNITTVNYLDITTLDDLNPNDEKMEFDKFLISKLRETGSAVVIDHFEHLAPQAALLMHSYADGDNAPVKRAMLALVYYMDIEQLRDRDDVENSLRKLWREHLDHDKIGALLSRIANNIVAISPEGTDTVMHIC